MTRASSSCRRTASVNSSTCGGKSRGGRTWSRLSGFSSSKTVPTTRASDQGPASARARSGPLPREWRSRPFAACEVRSRRMTPVTTRRTTGFNRTFSRLSLWALRLQLGSSRVSRTFASRDLGWPLRSTGFADSNERREGTGSPKSAVLGTALNVCQPQTKEYDK